MSRGQSHPRKQQESQKKPPQFQKAIEDTLALLATDLAHPSLRVKRVQRAAGVFEASVDMDNRLTFHVEGDVIVLRNHCNHSILDRRP